MQACGAQPGSTYAVVRPSGDLDLLTIDELRGQLAEAIDSPHSNVIVDLRDVDYVDIVAISAMLAAADSLREAGRQLRVSSASPAVRRVCALLRADDVLMPPSGG